MANHVIFELSPLALNFTIKRIKDPGAEYITAEGLGSKNFLSNFNIISENTKLVHHARQDNTNKENNHISVRVWKIINKGVNIPNDFDLTYSITKTKTKTKTKTSTINIIERKLKLPIKLYRQILGKRYGSSSKSKSQELLTESMPHPKITIDAKDLQNYLSS